MPRGTVQQRDARGAVTVQAEDQPSWAEIVRHAEHGESVSVIAHGDHVAEIIPSGQLDRLRETIEALPDSDRSETCGKDWRTHATDACSPPTRLPLTWPRAAPPTNAGTTPSLSWQ
jgi:antitoxin (DNA-binding transcriptional repressor) of toxin-antitoxin stability system